MDNEEDASTYWYIIRAYDPSWYIEYQDAKTVVLLNDRGTRVVADTLNDALHAILSLIQERVEWRTINQWIAAITQRYYDI